MSRNESNAEFALIVTGFTLAMASFVSPVPYVLSVAGLLLSSTMFVRLMARSVRGGR